MKLRKLKKYLKYKLCYFQTEGSSLYIEQRHKFINKKGKLKLIHNGWDYITYGTYDSFICETDESYLYSNKELKEYLKRNKGKIIFED